MRMLRGCVSATALLITWQAATANPLSNAWSCAKSAGMTQVAVGKELYKKGETIAKMAGPLAACLAKTGPEAQALMATSSTLTALRLSQPSLLGNQCEARIKAVATKPFAEGLAALMPASQAKSELIAAARSEQSTQIVWEQIGQLPRPFSMVPDQISCGCLVSDAGLSLSDISDVTNAVSNAGASCSKMLDSLGLGIVKDLGGYGLKVGKAVATGVSDKWDELVGGQSAPSSPDIVFADYFGQFLEGTAQNMVVDPSGWASVPVGYHKGSCSIYEPSKCQVTIGQLLSECIAYYDEHKMSKGHASQVCAEYRNALVAAATARAQHMKAAGELPTVLGQRITKWIVKDWLWRLPKYNNASGSVHEWDGPGSSLFYEWSDIWGSASYSKGKGAPAKGEWAWDYKAAGLFATARSMLPELGQDPARSADLAYAGAQSALRDKAQGIWNEHRHEQAKYQLEQWYPKTPVGDRYDCPGGLLKECTEAMEADYDAHCFPAMSHHYVSDLAGMGLAPAYQKIANQCRASLDKIAPRATKLIDGEGAAKEVAIDKCSAIADRNARNECVSGYTTLYLGCAAQALRDGQDDASACFSRALVAHGISRKLQPVPLSKPALGDKRAAPRDGIFRPGRRPPPTVSTLCRFTFGPHAGQIQDYAPMAPLPVGSPCQDARGSTGVVIAPE